MVRLRLVSLAKDAGAALASVVVVMPKLTSAQRFHNIFKQWTSGATEHVRNTAEKKMDEWLARNGKTRADISSIVAEAVADDLKANPPSQPPDPRDVAANPFDSSEFSPAGLVAGILEKYVAAKPDLFTVLALWVPFTYVYTHFRIAPRIAVTGPTDSGKSTLEDVLRRLVFRPNRESLGTGAAIRNFYDGGPGTVLLDELEYAEAEARKALRKIWNLGHKQGAVISLLEAGKLKYTNIHGPMLAAGINLTSIFMGPAQQNRAFVFEMEPYTEENEPPCKLDDGFENIDRVYVFLRHWAEKVRAGKVKLNPNPPMPPGLRRFGDNIRGLLAVADACGWGQRARETFTVLFEKERAERPQIRLLRHILLIFEMLEPELDQLSSTKCNDMLVRKLDEPDANWRAYRGESGTEVPHPLRPDEQARLLAKVDVGSETCWPPGPRQKGGSFKGYKLAKLLQA